MGENKIDQRVEQTETDQQQDYGSQQQGRHNLEVTFSQRTDESGEGGFYNPSMEEQNRVNQQSLGTQGRKENFEDYKIDDDNRTARVEGDDRDILGDTENSLRNQQSRLRKESNSGSAQNR